MLCLTLSVFFNSILLRIERGVGVKGERKEGWRCVWVLCLTLSVFFNSILLRIERGVGVKGER